MNAIDGHAIFLKNRINDYQIKFPETQLDKYNGFYSNIPEPLNIIFSLFHYNLNKLFQYMNYRLYSNYYTAEESRELIFIIDEIELLQSNLRNTKYYFEFEQYYRDILAKCSNFLRPSSGSPIPEDFKKIRLIETNSIFLLKTMAKINFGRNTGLYPLKPIGGGSYAEVFKYKDEHYDRFFAVKKAKNLSPKEFERFKLEFEEMKKLKSPYVIEVYRFDEENKEYTMEYADYTLEKYINQNNNTLSFNERVILVRQVLRAFSYINSRNVLHRDISPRNVLIKEYDDGLKVVKVSDFGLVKTNDSLLTDLHSEVKGSFNDPRLNVIGFVNYEVRHETFALTRLVYYIMTGKTKLEKYNDSEFERFIKKGVSDEINDRYVSVRDLNDAFLKCLNKLK